MSSINYFLLIDQDGSRLLIDQDGSRLIIGSDILPEIDKRTFRPAARDDLDIPVDDRQAMIPAQDDLDIPVDDREFRPTDDRNYEVDC